MNSDEFQERAEWMAEPFKTSDHGCMGVSCSFEGASSTSLLDLVGAASEVCWVENLVSYATLSRLPCPAPFHTSVVPTNTHSSS